MGLFHFLLVSLWAAVLGHETCCDSKVVNGLNYTLLGNYTHQYQGYEPSYPCLSRCTYKTSSKPGKVFCFERGDFKVVRCEEPCHHLATSVPVKNQFSLYKDPKMIYHCVCNQGYAGDGHCCLVDSDSDGTPDRTHDGGTSCHLHITPDNCPSRPNSGQEDSDDDGEGNACDRDADNDGIRNDRDNCPTHYNPAQTDADGDRVGNTCDNCIYIANRDQADRDKDGKGDLCDQDEDGDGINNDEDNCLLIPNPKQIDTDDDYIGDECDNCRTVYNTGQEDEDNNLVGDACDGGADRDRDGIPDAVDNCPDTPNSDQLDGLEGLADGVGDACDDDNDNDGVKNEDDNCPLVPNTNQEDSNGDGEGDACDGDCDQDNINNERDICPCDHKKGVTDFSVIQSFDVGESNNFQPAPEWEFRDDGKEIYQALNSRAGLAIGNQVYGDVRFKGTVFTNNWDNDILGIVFGYQNNKNFYTLTATETASRQGNWKVSRIESETGHPSKELQYAIFRFRSTVNVDVPGQTKVLWGPDVDFGWKRDTAYTWILEHRPSQGKIFVKIYEKADLIIDEEIDDPNGLTGGRLGVYTHSQAEVTWSGMSTQCL